MRPFKLISAICTFSATVMDTNVCAIWKVRPTPRRQMRRGARPVMVSPARRTRPLSGCSWPPSMLKIVVLPAPFGPMTASSLPASTANVTLLAATTPPNDLLNPSTLSRLMPGPFRVPISLRGPIAGP